MESFFSGIIEFFMELLFSVAPTKPEDIPEPEYRSHFIVRHNRKRMLANLILSAVLILVFGLLWILLHDQGDIWLLYALLVLLGLVTLFFALEGLLYSCQVDENKLQEQSLGRTKSILWRDISCVRVIIYSKKDYASIVLYDPQGKRTWDFSSDMENAWYILHMAHEKKLPTPYARDLSWDEAATL